MNDYEMSYLNWLQKEYAIKQIVHNVQKIYGLIIGDKSINFTDTVNIDSLSIEEDFVIKSLCSKLEISDIKKYKDSSLMFKSCKVVYKIFMVYDNDYTALSVWDTIAFDPIHEEDININICIIGQEVLNNRAKLIQALFMLATTMINDYALLISNNKLDNIIFKDNLKYLRRSIDFFIIIIKTLDGILDLKYDDWKPINDLLDKDYLIYAYIYAINLDATEEDYYKMIIDTFDKFKGE